MSTQPSKDPIEDLDFTQYDEETETLTVQVHRYLHKYSQAKLAERAIEIMNRPHVRRVVWIMRPQEGSDDDDDDDDDDKSD